MEQQTNNDGAQSGSTPRKRKKENPKRELSKRTKNKEQAECGRKEKESDLTTRVLREDSVSTDGQMLCTPRKDNTASDDDAPYLPKTFNIAPPELKDQQMNYATPITPLRRVMHSVDSLKSNIMIIFNHTKVNGYDDRQSCVHDVKNLRKTFVKYNFNDNNIIVRPDRSQEELKNDLDAFLKRDFTNFGCVAVVVLTHGDGDGYLRAKDRSYHESELINHDSYKDNQTLANKPKILIIQACRGKKEPIAAFVGKYTENNMENKKHVPRLSLQSNLKYPDMLLLHSTCDGVVSYGDQEKGSWLIQSLCKNMDKHSDTKHFEEILTHVRSDVSTNYGREVMNHDTGQIEILKQVPVVMSTLTKEVIF